MLSCGQRGIPHSFQLDVGALRKLLIQGSSETKSLSLSFLKSVGFSSGKETLWDWYVLPHLMETGT